MPLQAAVEPTIKTSAPNIIIQGGHFNHKNSAGQGPSVTSWINELLSKGRARHEERSVPLTSHRPSFDSSQK